MDTLGFPKMPNYDLVYSCKKNEIEMKQENAEMVNMDCTIQLQVKNHVLGFSPILKQNIYENIENRQIKVAQNFSLICILFCKYSFIQRPIQKDEFYIRPLLSQDSPNSSFYLQPIDEFIYSRFHLFLVSWFRDPYIPFSICNLGIQAQCRPNIWMTIHIIPYHCPYYWS